MSREPVSNVMRAAKARHLLFRQLILRVLGQTRDITPLAMLAMTGKIIGHRATVRFMLLHADRQRLDPAQHKKALERRKNAASTLLHEGKGLFMFGRRTPPGRHPDRRCGH